LTLTSFEKHLKISMLTRLPGPMKFKQSKVLFNRRLACFSESPALRRERDTVIDSGARIFNSAFHRL
jgi:hypothetical protein